MCSLDDSVHDYTISYSAYLVEIYMSPVFLLLSFIMFIVRSTIRKIANTVILFCFHLPAIMVENLYASLYYVTSNFIVKRYIQKIKITIL